MQSWNRSASAFIVGQMNVLLQGGAGALVLLIVSATRCHVQHVRRHAWFHSIVFALSVMRCDM